MAVAVAHEDVHEPRGEKRVGVDPVVGAGIDPLEELRGRNDPAGPGERLAPLVQRGGTLLHHPEHPLELGAEFAEGGVVRQHGEAPAAPGARRPPRAGALATSDAAGCEALTPSRCSLARVLVCSHGARRAVGSLSTERNWYWRPSAPVNRIDLVWLPECASTGVSPPP